MNGAPIARIGTALPRVLPLTANSRPVIPDVGAALRCWTSAGGALQIGLPGTRRDRERPGVDSGPGQGATAGMIPWLA